MDIKYHRRWFTVGNEKVEKDGEMCNVLFQESKIREDRVYRHILKPPQTSHGYTTKSHTHNCITKLHMHDTITHTWMHDKITHAWMHDKITHAWMHDTIAHAWMYDKITCIEMHGKT